MICRAESRNLTKCNAEFTQFFRRKPWSPIMMSDCPHSHQLQMHSVLFDRHLDTVVLSEATDCHGLSRGLPELTAQVYHACFCPHSSYQNDSVQYLYARYRSSRRTTVITARKTLISLCNVGRVDLVVRVLNSQLTGRRFDSGHSTVSGQVVHTYLLISLCSIIQTMMPVAGKVTAGPAVSNGSIVQGS